MIATLKDYYKSKGQSLPALKDRAKTYESLGLGAATAYQGSYDQNTSLLKRLQQTPTPTAAPVSPVAVAPKPSIQTAPVAAAPVSTSPTTTQPDTYSTLFDKVKKSTGLEDVLNSIKSALTSQPKKADLYTQELANTGISQDQTALKSLDERIAATDTALRQSEKDIRDRISNSGGLVTESQVQRLAAAEKAPLIDEYKTLSSSRATLADRINNATSQASKMADLRYSDANQPYTTAKAQLDLINPVFNSTLSAAEKDLQTRLNESAALTKAAEKTKTDATAQDKTMAGKGYQYVSTPAQRDQLKKQGYDIFELGGRTYAKPGVLATYEAKKAVDAKFKPVKTTATKKTTTPKNYTGTTIPGNLKSEIVTNFQAGADVNDVIKAYPEVDSNYIKSLAPKKPGRTT